MSSINAVLLVALLTWSWCFINKEPAVSDQIHSSIQAGIKDLITNYVAKNVPTANKVQFDKVWSETINEHQVKAYFTYSFEDHQDSENTVNIQLTGSALLNKELSNNPSDEIQWNLDDLIISDNVIHFQTPLQITPQENNDN